MSRRRDEPTAPGPSRDRSALASLLLLGFAALLPLALFGWIAWSERDHALQDAGRTARHTAAVLHEHAARVMETNELVLSEIARQTEGRAWPDIARDVRLWTALLRVAGDLRTPTDITLADRDGQVRLTSARFPAAAADTIREAEDFRTLRDSRNWSHIGVATGADGSRELTLSRRRVNADGRFDGLIRIGIPVAQFTDFWTRFAPPIAYSIPLVRSDGLVIVRQPRITDADRLLPDSPLLAEARRAAEGTIDVTSSADGRPRIAAFARINDYPLIIAFGIDRGAVLRGWLARIAPVALFTAVAVLGLVAAAAMALRRHRAEREDGARWREVADRLAEESRRREQAEAALRRAQTLEAVGQLTAGVAHDFNNLLQAIRSGLHLLAPKLPEPSQRVLDACQQAVDRGARLVRQLMIFARRERLLPQPVDPRRLVAGMAELLQKAVGAPVTIDIAIAPDIAPALVDPTQAELAILNLAINARDAMPLGGTLTITARNAATSDGGAPAGLAPGDYVVLTIGDTGTGMAPDVLDRALEPFFTTKAVGRGSGLGLSMVHGFVTQSGGAMRIETHPGAGARISLWLPRALAMPEDLVPASPAPVATEGGLSLLLVDDDALARLATAAALRSLGHEVLEARDGEEALIVLGQRRDLRVMVTDYAMPQMNGADLAVRARRGRPDLAVVMITGYAAGLPGGRPPQVRAVLRKPFAVEDLDAAVRDAAMADPVLLR